MAGQATTGEAAGAAAAHGEHVTGMPQLDIATFGNQIFWLLIALFAVYFIISKLALPRIGAIIDQRQDAITGDLAKAADLKRQAEDADAAYHAALAEARAESQRISAETRAEIQKELDVAISRADAEIAAKAAESEGRIAEIQAGAAQAVKTVARDTAAELVRKLVPAAVDDKALDAAISARVKG
jgi:F-type H+-transporting ATPase subunit b